MREVAVEMVRYLRDFIVFTFGPAQLLGASLMVLVWLGFWALVEKRGRWRELLETEPHDAD